MRCSLAFYRITKVPTRSVVPNEILRYHPRYSVSRKMTLSNSFNAIDDTNRFLSLKLMLEKLSGHVGRRQYKMQCDLTRHFQRLKEEGIDWHELKWLSREELIDVFDHVLSLSSTERASLLSALEAKVCGVLCRSDSRHSTALCMNRGVAEHGWRCGTGGHTSDVYFEGKAKANPAVLQLYHRSSVRTIETSGVRSEVRTAPDFSVVGRFNHSLNPRVWSTPENPSFQVRTIGFEFRVHPDDPRVIPQIEDSAQQWKLHAEATQQVIWEMLEMYGVEKDPQPIDQQPWEMGIPDSPSAYSSAFSLKEELPHLKSEREESEEINGETVIEQRMFSTDGKDHPWFMEPLPQRFSHGIPFFLPFAPTIIIRSSFRRVTRGSSSDDITHQLLQPVVDISCFVHPKACFWWSEDNEERCIAHIVDYAKRIPFALPFNLYIRVDPSKFLRAEPNRGLEMDKRMEEKAHYFDLQNFRSAQDKTSTT